MKQRIRIQSKSKTARIFPPAPTFAAFVTNMKEHGGKTAFMWNAREGEEKDGAINYELFAEEVELAAAALTEEGLAGRRIAFLGNPSVTYAAFLIAVMATGGAVLPLDRERPTEDVALLLRRGGAVALFYGSGVKADMAALCKEEGLSLVCAMENALPLPDHPKARKYADVLLSGAKVLSADNGFTFPSLDPATPAALIYTSGTLKERKCAVLSVSNLLSELNAACAAVDLEKADVVLSVLPFHHSYELASLLVLLNYGVTVVLNDTPASFYDNMKKYRPTGLFLVPSILSAIYARLWDTNKQMKHARGLHYGIKASNILLSIGIDLREKFFSRTRSFFGGRLSKIVSGGAPLSPSIISSFESLGIAVYDGYGVTECGPFVTMTPYFARRVGSVGKPLSSVTLRINAEEPSEEYGYPVGEIEVKGDSVMVGYDGDPEATADAFTLDGYFRTGDIGYLDKDGYLYVTGRKKTVIVLDNGRNVAPEELEEYLNATDEIEDALVYAERDEGGALRLYASLYPSPVLTAKVGAQEAQAAVKARVAEINHHLPIFKQILSVTLVDAPHPRSATGKLYRDGHA